LEDLRARFDRPLADVATEYGVCLTYIKRLCRSYDIKRWPYRKIQSLQTKADKLTEMKASSAADAVRNYIQALQHETGSTPMPQNVSSQRMGHDGGSSMPCSSGAGNGQLRMWNEFPLFNTAASVADLVSSRIMQQSSMNQPSGQSMLQSAMQQSSHQGYESVLDFTQNFRQQRMSDIPGGQTQKMCSEQPQQRYSEKRQRSFESVLDFMQPTQTSQKRQRSSEPVLDFMEPNGALAGIAGKSRKTVDVSPVNAKYPVSPWLGMSSDTQNVSQMAMPQPREPAQHHSLQGSQLKSSDYSMHPLLMEPATFAHGPGRTSSSVLATPGNVFV